MKPLIFIAGGSQGLGKALCEQYTQEDWEVIELSRSGEGKKHVYCDFSDVKGSNNIFKKLFETYKQSNHPQINLIINTASLTPIGQIANFTEDEILQHLGININSAIMLIHQFSKIFQNHTANKTLAYISSGAARRNIEGMALYCASKAALERMVLTFNQEQQSQIHPVNAMVINPGVMDTGMQDTIRKQKKEDFPLLDHWTQLHKQGQLADAITVAKICHKLITKPNSDKSYHAAQDYI